MSFNRAVTHRVAATALLMFVFAFTLPVAGLNENQRIEKRIGSHMVAVDARAREAAPCENPKSWIWGADQECPKKVLSLLSIKWANQNLLVPASAYLDLAALHSIAIEPANAGFSLKLEGGDAATSYTARLEFDGDPLRDQGVLRRRVVRHGEFPKLVWEETRYSFHPGTESEAPIRR